MITLDGRSLTIEQLAQIARDPSIHVERDPSTNERVARSEALIGRIVENYRRAFESGEAPPTEYGVTTGFGEFKDKRIAPDDLQQLQRNLLLSHSVGVCGDDAYFDAEVVRAALVTRLNAFLLGHSGVRRTMVEIVEAMINRGVIPLVPLKGSVGASGDLCPLAHTFATLLGVGDFVLNGQEYPATELPSVLGFDAEVMKPTFKEGLALVNGVNYSAAMLALGVFDAQHIADAIAADLLTIALAELANISERRTAMLLDGNHNRRLPQNLTTRPGVNTGLMIAQYTAASLVSENKVLSHPASVDSIPTSANAEDHVSMSTYAARKMRTVLRNTQNVLAIEFLVSAQALDWRIGMSMDPLAPRREMSLADADEQAQRFAAVQPANVANSVAPALREFYLRVREVSPPVVRDRALSDDVRRVYEALFSVRAGFSRPTG